jgi:hypothetical protein
VCTTTRLVCSRPAFAPVAVLFAGLALHRNFLYGASIAIPLVGLALHRHALCQWLLAWLDFHTELSMQKGQLLVELASCLREFVESRAQLIVSTAVARSCSMQWPRRRCTPAWGRDVARSVPSESS